jgi:hypothetical protein
MSWLSIRTRKGTTMSWWAMVTSLVWARALVAPRPTARRVVKRNDRFMQFPSVGRDAALTIADFEPLS